MQKRNIELKSLQAHQISDKVTQLSTLSTQMSKKNYSSEITLQPYPTQIQMSTVCFISLCNFLYTLLCKIFYILLAYESESAASQIKNIIVWLQYNETAIMCPLLAIKLLIFSTLYLVYNISQAQEFHNLLVSLCKRLKSWLRCFIQLDLLLSVFFLCAQTALSCINFAISAVIITLSVMFLENYINKKDSFFIGSVKFHVIIRIKIIIGSLVNFICLSFGGNSLSLGVFVLVHSMLAIATSLAYASQGFIIYKTPILKWGIFISVAAYLSITMVMVMGMIAHINISTLLVYNLLMIIAVFYYLSQHISQKKLTQIHQFFNFEGQSFCFLEILQQMHNEDEIQSYVLGLMNISQRLNPLCNVHRNVLPSRKEQPLQYVKQTPKDDKSLLNLYMKCKFQSFLEENSTSSNAMFNYAQFLYLELGSTASSLYWLSKISSNDAKIDIINKLKWSRLIQKIREDNQQLSQQTFGKNFDIEGLIKAESIKAEIIKSTMELLQQKIGVWRLLNHTQIDISQLRFKTQKIRKGIQKDTKSWNQISTFVQLSRNWKFQYSCFALFLRNQKLPAKLFEDLRTPMQAQQSREQQPKTAINNIFEVDSCCIHTIINQGRILIAKASKNCINVTGYSSAQLENASMNLLVPSLIADKHHQAIVNMSKDGISSNDNSKKFSQVYINNKQGYIVPVQKCYKQFVNQLGKLEYVCYLKKVNKHESVFLCNQNFQIQGFTQKCDKMLSQHKNGIYIKYFNILSFIPELIKGKTISQQDKMPKNGQKQSGYHLQGQNKAHHSQFRFLKAISEQSLEYNIWFPQQPLQSYLTIANNGQKCSLDEQISNIVRQIKNRAHRNIPCQVELNCYQNRIGLVYYQVKLKKIKPQISEHFERSSIQIMQQNHYCLPLKPDKSQLCISNISSRSNIYIKQEANEAPKVNIYITCMKYLWAILFAGILTFSILSMSLFEQQFNNMAVSINNIYVANQLLIVMSQLVNLYIAKILNIATAMSIPETIDIFQGFLNNPLMHQAFFKKTINPPAMYYAASDFSQNGTGYNQIDFLFFTQSLFRTLSQTESIASGSSSYNLIMDFQYPALNNFLNLTNTNLSTEFTGYEDTLKFQYMIVFTLEILLIAVSAGLILFYSYRFYCSMLEMVKIHCQFTPHDISKNVKHHKKVILIFYGLQQLEDNKFSQSGIPIRLTQLKQGSIIYNQTQSSNLNKKSKSIATGKQLQKQRLFYFFKIIVCFVAFTALCMSRNLYFMSLEYPAKSQMIEGQNFLNFIPTHQLTAQIVANAYLPTVMPASYPERYQPLLSNLQILMNMPYLPISQSDDAFSQLTNQFYFTDACLVSISALKSNNVTLEECQSVANHSLKGGLQQYSRHQYKLLQDILSKGYSPSFQEVKEYFQSIDIYSTINSFVMNAWVDSYNKLTVDNSAKIEKFTLLTCLAIFLLTILLKLHIYRYLKSEYLFYKFFYATMMPQEIISGEKIICSKLTEIKFL